MANSTRMLVETRRHAADTPWTYSSLDARQKEIALGIVRRGDSGRILLSEVAPVVTLGRRTGPSDFLVARSALARMGVDVLNVDRGGMATYHGPGQWVLFVVERLDRLVGDTRAVKRAVEMLLQIGLEVARNYESRAEIKTGEHTGIWTKRGKVGSVGVHAHEGVLLHGLSLNGFETRVSFMGIKPCGMDPREHLMDYLLGRVEKHSEEFSSMGIRLAHAAVSAVPAASKELGDVDSRPSEVH